MTRHEQLAEDIARALGDLLDRANYKPNSTDLKYMDELTQMLIGIYAKLEHDKLVDNPK